MASSFPLSTLNDLFTHHYWARDRQLHACAVLSSAQFLQPLGNSHPSVRDTLGHLLAAEWLWLERWRGRSPRILLAPADFTTLDDIAARWRQVEHEMREFLATLSEAALERDVTYVNTRGGTWTHALWRLMVHLLEHQAYHRGQVTTLLRQLGVQPPAVDFLVGLDANFRV